MSGKTVRINKNTKVMTITSANGSRKALGKVGSEKLIEAINRLASARKSAALEALTKFELDSGLKNLNFI